MPTPALLAAGFAVLMALAYALRWAYRTWLVLLLASLGVAWGVQHWLATRLQQPQAPAFAQAAAQRLHALPWPATLEGQAGLLASLNGLRQVGDVVALELAYRVAVLRGMAGEPPQSFATVADALAWRQSLGSAASTFGKAADPARRQQWDALRELEERVLATLLEVASVAPDVPGATGASGVAGAASAASAFAVSDWPAELQRQAPLLPLSRAVGPGLWLAPKPGGSGEQVLQFPLRVTHRGEGRILDAQVALAAHAAATGTGASAASAAPGAPPGRPLGSHRFFCWVALRDLAPGESRLLKCDVATPALQAPATQRLLADVAALRAGELAIWPTLTVPLDHAALHAPRAAPLNPAELARFAALEAADAQAAREALQWGQLLQGWLAVGGVALLGFAVPGARGRAVPLAGVLAQGVAVGLLAAVGGWYYVGQFGGMTGYAPLVVLFLAGAAAVVFTGGVLLGNVVRSRAA